MIEILKDLVFVGLIALLLWFFVIYLPSKNSKNITKREDLVPVDESLINANELCAEMHGSTYLTTMKNEKYCLICSQYRI